MSHATTGRRVLAGIAGLCGLLTAVPVPVTARAAQWNPNQQAVDRCESELRYRMADDAKARDPQASLDYDSLNVRQPSRTQTTVAGRGRFRRDQFDRPRDFTFSCSVDMRSGYTRVSYNWGGGWGNDFGNDPGYPSQPPSYRPPYPGGGNSNAYPPANRTFYSGGIFNRASGKALDVQDRSTRDAANVQQWDFASAPNQMWEVVDQGDGRFAIMSQGSNKALDGADHRANDGANVQQFRFAGGDNQLWRLQRVGGGFYQIISVSSGKCLDVELARINDNGANVQQWSCSSQPNQLWRLGR